METLAVGCGAGFSGDRTDAPLGRAGSALEVAQAALWLASDDASYVHGAIVDVAGGR